jgi:hypothetical protein
MLQSCEGVFMFCLHSVFYVPGSDGSLVSAIALKDKKIVGSSGMLFYVTQK